MSKVGPRKLAAVCYDHIGGALGESLYDALVRKAWISSDRGELKVTPKGRRELAALGVPVEELDAAGRKQVNACVERHAGMFYAHIGSHLGSLLAAALVEQGWLERSGREFHITPSGRRGLRKLGVKYTS
jgi:ParB-like chromosome segregation protein Spo0J